MTDNTFDISDAADRVARAAKPLAVASTGEKNEALASIARQLRRHTSRILEQNAADLESAKQKNRDEAFIDRLKLTGDRIEKMASDVEEIIEAPDPVGQTDQVKVRPNGLRVGRRRIPLGVVGLIYEARPNVTTDASALCLKSGNGILLKGGSDAFESNRAIHDVIQRGLRESPLPEEATEAVGFVETTDRSAVEKMLQLEEALDVIIPRGGEGLIRFVTDNSQIPVIKHEKGVCHIVVDESAPAERVDSIVMNAKTQRPSVCNAVETLLFLENALDPHLVRTLERLDEAGVKLHVGKKVRSSLPDRFVSDANLTQATPESYREEFLGLELAVRAVPDLDAAIDHITTYGSRHTEALLTEKYTQSQNFQSQIDSSVVVVNASTRFSDGNQLGLGAEIGISTTRLHAYGPMGLEELTTRKFVVLGNGQIRE